MENSLKREERTYVPLRIWYSASMCESASFKCAGNTQSWALTCNIPFAVGQPFVSYLEWSHCELGEDQSRSLQPYTDFISVQFHPWVLNLEAAWSSSPNFLVGITPTTDHGPGGCPKLGGNISRCRRHELKDLFYYLPLSAYLLHSLHQCRTSRSPLGLRPIYHPWKSSLLTYTLTLPLGPVM